MRNESLMIRYFMRHYSSFCERIVVYDDRSEDDTADFARSAGAEVRPCPYQGLDDIEAVALAQRTYPEARGQADWVMWVDADEFVYHPQLTERLAALKSTGITVPLIAGYSMVADEPPSGDGQIYDEIRKGFPDPSYTKSCVFDPAINISWSTGRHEAYILDGTQVSVNEDDPIKLLHFRYLGAEWHIRRNVANYASLNLENKSRSHGREVYPGYEGPHSPDWYAEQVANAREVI